MRNDKPRKDPGFEQERCRHIHFHSLRFASQLELAQAHGRGFHLVHGHARATRVRIPAGWQALCLPLASHLQLQANEREWRLEAGRLQVWCDGELWVGNRSGDGWLLLAGPAQEWTPLLRSVSGSDMQPLLPSRHDCPRSLRRLLVRLARALRREGLGDPGMVLEALLLETLACQQRNLGPHLARCSGRTPARRQQTLQRLLRVHMLIETCNGDRLDMASLARSANYSPWHLIRMYREVFGETPSEHAQRLRMQRAWMLVRETRLPVCEIAEVLGFESQSSFCRAFRQAHGATAGDVRRLHEAACAYGQLPSRPPARAA